MTYAIVDAQGTVLADGFRTEGEGNEALSEMGPNLYLVNPRELGLIEDNLDGMAS